MKRTPDALCLLAAAALLLAAAPPARAAGLKAGATVWYTWWDGANRNITTGKAIPGSFRNRYRQVPAFLYGPMLAADFNARWSASVIFAVGTDLRSYGSFVEPWMMSYRRQKNRYLRYDLDPTVTFAVNRYVKFFAGLKLQGYVIRGKSKFTYTNRYEESDPKTIFTAVGTGAGLGLTLPLYRDLYFIANLSGLYLYAPVVRRETFTTIGTTYTNVDFNRIRGHIVNDIAGGNASASLAWYVPRASLTFALGGRYQVMWFRIRKIDFSSDTTSMRYGGMSTFAGPLGETINEYVGRRSYHGKYDHFYGLTFSVIYSFDFAKSKEGA